MLSVGRVEEATVAPVLQHKSNDTIPEPRHTALPDDPPHPPHPHHACCTHSERLTFSVAIHIRALAHLQSVVNHISNRRQGSPVYSPLASSTVCACSLSSLSPGAARSARRTCHCRCCQPRCRCHQMQPFLCKTRVHQDIKADRHNAISEPAATLPQRHGRRRTLHVSDKISCNPKASNAPFFTPSRFS